MHLKVNEKEFGDDGFWNIVTRADMETKCKLCPGFDVSLKVQSYETPYVASHVGSPTYCIYGKTLN